MILHFQTKALRQAVAQLLPILGSKSTLPVLGGIHIWKAKTWTSLGCSNLDIWSNVQVESTGDFEPSSFIVPGKLLHEALSRITAESLEMTTSASHCVIKAGSAKLSLPLIVDPFPAIPEGVQWGKPFLIDGLQEKLKRCLPFASRDATRYVLNSVYLGKDYIEAGNGRKVIRVSEPKLGQNAIVPSELVDLVTKTTGTVTTRTGGNLIEFSGEGWTITGKLIESTVGTWVDTSSIYDRKTVMTVKSSARELIEAASLAAFSLAKEVDSVAVEVKEDALRFASEGNSAICPAECTAFGLNSLGQTSPLVKGELHDFSVSASALESALKAAASDKDEVELAFSDVQSVQIEQGGVLLSQC